jgi:hypothetical protein
MTSLLVIAVVYAGCWTLVKMARKADNCPSSVIDEASYYYAQDEQGQAFLREHYLACRRLL